MFRSPADQELRLALLADRHFRLYIDRLRQEYTKAVADMLYASPQDVIAKQGYVRCLAEQLDELTTTGE